MNGDTNIRRTRTGAVDVAFYQARARCLRSALVRRWASRLVRAWRQPGGRGSSPATIRNCAGYQL